MGGGAATLRALLREYLFVSLFRTCAESLASENASRLAAMQRAAKNIGESLEDLTRKVHRLRQSGIDGKRIAAVIWTGLHLLAKQPSIRVGRYS